MQISGWGGAEIVGGENYKNPVLIRWHMNAGILFWEDSPNHFAQHLKFLIPVTPLPPH